MMINQWISRYPLFRQTDLSMSKRLPWFGLGSLLPVRYSSAFRRRRRYRVRKVAYMDSYGKLVKTEVPGGDSEHHQTSPNFFLCCSLMIWYDMFVYVEWGHSNPNVGLAEDRLPLKIGWISSPNGHGLGAHGGPMGSLLNLSSIIFRPTRWDPRAYIALSFPLNTNSILISIVSFDIIHSLIMFNCHEPIYIM